MDGVLVLALALLQFTGPTGLRIDLNVEAITSVRDPRAMPQGHWGVGTNCIIMVDNSPPIAVQETCDEVRREIGEAAKK